MRKLMTMTVASGAILAMAGIALAQTADGTTLAGGNNGADAKASTTKAVEMPQGKSGSPGATPAPGQSTEQSDGKMRAHQNF